MEPPIEEVWEGMFNPTPPNEPGKAGKPSIKMAFETTFNSPTGKEVLAFLEKVTVLQPSFSPGENAFTAFANTLTREGQKQLFFYIKRMAEV